MAILMGRVGPGGIFIVRVSTRRSTGAGEAGAGFCPLRAHGADATSDSALKTLIILIATTSVGHSQTHRVCRFEPRAAEPQLRRHCDLGLTFGARPRTRF